MQFIKNTLKNGEQHLKHESSYRVIHERETLNSQFMW
jgi:hypothetical protein